jgi:predicted small integral membrane protein
MDHVAWMAWTPATGVFFATIALLLLVMTLLAWRRPEAERVGILGIATTRGDRLFISLIAAALVHLAWIGVAGTNTIATLPFGGGIELSSLWLATAISLGLAVGIFRTV